MASRLADILGQTLKLGNPLNEAQNSVAAGQCSWCKVKQHDRCSGKRRPQHGIKLPCLCYVCKRRVA